ncbi:membrane-bound transcription factor site-2 protease [Pyrus ussuriensis x Pyrus communis]|uniref:Membrane-bound transcription factor site-2 protease n=1 Tax=Pyrus ussuriensis x Pyrus communis TaxID=2448454 RepID=A0A5N5GQT3_9ROSA|nr:membrane-bound transcription factor site-2 protease [Pyrus ussuriensis x Pyrus communis]
MWVPTKPTVPVTRTDFRRFLLPRPPSPANLSPPLPPLQTHLRLLQTHLRRFLLPRPQSLAAIATSNSGFSTNPSSISARPIAGFSGLGSLSASDSI